MYSVLKRLLVGRPLPSAELHRGVLVRIEEQWEAPRLDMPLDIISGEG